MLAATRAKVHLLVLKILSDEDDASLGVLFIAKNVWTNTIVQCAVHEPYNVIEAARNAQSVLSMYSHRMHNDTMLLASGCIGLDSQLANPDAAKVKRKRPRFLEEDEL